MSKLDKHREEIIALLKTGYKQVYIATMGITQPKLYNCLRRHNLAGIKP
jgi:hypothetical protein